MLLLVMVLVLGTMGLALIRAVRGPTVYDRILAANAFSTKTIVMVVTFGFVVGDPGLYLDIALMYALIGFILPRGSGLFFVLFIFESISLSKN